VSVFRREDPDSILGLHESYAADRVAVGEVFVLVLKFPLTPPPPVKTSFHHCFTFHHLSSQTPTRKDGSLPTIKKTATLLTKAPFCGVCSRRLYRNYGARQQASIPVSGNTKLHRTKYSLCSYIHKHNHSILQS